LKPPSFEPSISFSRLVTSRTLYETGETPLEEAPVDQLKYSDVGGRSVVAAFSPSSSSSPAPARQSGVAAGGLLASPLSLSFSFSQVQDVTKRFPLLLFLHQYRAKELIFKQQQQQKRSPSTFPLLGVSASRANLNLLTSNSFEDPFSVM